MHKSTNQIDTRPPALERVRILRFIAPPHENVKRLSNYGLPQPLPPNLLQVVLLEIGASAEEGFVGLGRSSMFVFCCSQLDAADVVSELEEAIALELLSLRSSDKCPLARETLSDVMRCVCWSLGRYKNAGKLPVLGGRPLREYQFPYITERESSAREIPTSYRTLSFSDKQSERRAA